MTILRNMQTRVLPPILQIAEEETAKIAQGITREGNEEMTTSKVNRMPPMTPHALIMDLARQMPFVALLGYFLFQVDARNEKNSAARLEEMKDSNRTLVGVVQANTTVLQRSVDSSERNEKSLSEILRHVSASPKKLGE